LADVAGSLPKALAVAGTIGNDVRVALPFYKQIEGGKYRTDFPVPLMSRYETAIIRESFIEVLLKAIKRALLIYREHPEQWHRLVKNAMEMDFFWARSAVKYLQLFQEAIGRRQSSRTMAIA